MVLGPAGAGWLSDLGDTVSMFGRGLYPEVDLWTLLQEATEEVDAGPAVDEASKSGSRPASPAGPGEGGAEGGPPEADEEEEEEDSGTTVPV